VTRAAKIGSETIYALLHRAARRRSVLGQRSVLKEWVAGTIRRRSMSINAHGIHLLQVDGLDPTYNRLGRYSTAGSTGLMQNHQPRPLGMDADKPDERRTDGTNSDYRAALASLWRRVWVLPRRLLSSRRTSRDRRHTRADPRRPRYRMAGLRARRVPLSPEK
jgi:hypothetical protein